MEFDYVTQPDPQLFVRLQELRDLSTIPGRGEARRAAISQETEWVIFEQVKRYGENHTTFDELPTIEDYARHTSLVQTIGHQTMEGFNYD